ncbi:MAG: hypothetical protein AAFU55_08030, partial [Pseudomonadota bacterium]
MLRDLIITLILITVIASGLWLTGIGRETMASAYDAVFGGEAEDENALSLADVEGMLLSGATWCYWPDL